MKRYVATITDGDCEVMVLTEGEIQGVPLSPRLDVRNHSPTGFAWGYGGSGPSQLALAICIDALGDVDRAIAIYHAYKWSVIARYPKDTNWETTQDDVVRTIETLEDVAFHRGEAPSF